MRKNRKKRGKTGRKKNPNKYIILHVIRVRLCTFITRQDITWTRVSTIVTPRKHALTLYALYVYYVLFSGFLNFLLFYNIFFYIRFGSCLHVTLYFSGPEVFFTIFVLFQASNILRPSVDSRKDLHDFRSYECNGFFCIRNLIIPLHPFVCAVMLVFRILSFEPGLCNYSYTGHAISSERWCVGQKLNLIG